MKPPIFVYDEELAVKAGQSNYITDTGAYIGKITLAKWITTQGGAKALELAFEDVNGLKSDYLTIYYQAKNGDAIASGNHMIQAILGCTGVKALTDIEQGDHIIAPELTEKRIGLMLQKVLRLKQDGSETYSFQIMCPFSPTSRKTLAEHRDNKPAERIDHLVATTKDKDERTKQNNQQNAYQAQQQFYGQGQGYGQKPWDGYTDKERNGHQQPPQDNFDDDIPF